MRDDFRQEDDEQLAKRLQEEVEMMQAHLL